MEIIRSPADPIEWEQVRALLLDYTELLRAVARIEPLHEQPSLTRELASPERIYDGAAAVLLAAFRGGLAVGTVAVRVHAAGRAELKRMYVRPIARRSGLADRLIEAAAVAAGERGCHTIWLETLRGVMDPAIAVYRRNGFVDRADLPRTIALDNVVVMEREVASVRVA